MIVDFKYDNVKKVLFGYQVQAGPTLNVVSTLVGKELEASGFSTALVEDIAESIVNLTNRLDSTEDPIKNLFKQGSAPTLAMFIDLVFGIGASDAIRTMDKFKVLTKQPYPDSPKTIFALAFSNGDMYSTDPSFAPSVRYDEFNSIEVGRYINPATDFHCVIDYESRAKEVKDNIYACVPDAVKKEFDGELGEWKAAMLFSEKFYE